jgi:hypothetical protein
MTLDAIIEVKADAGSILAEPDDVDADYVTIMEDPGDIRPVSPPLNPGTRLTMRLSP